MPRVDPESPTPRMPLPPATAAVRPWWSRSSRARTPDWARSRRVPRGPRAHGPQTPPSRGASPTEPRPPALISAPPPRPLAPPDRRPHPVPAAPAARPLSLLLGGPGCSGGEAGKQVLEGRGRVSRCSGSKFQWRQRGAGPCPVPRRWSRRCSPALRPEGCPAAVPRSPFFCARPGPSLLPGRLCSGRAAPAQPSGVLLSPWTLPRRREARRARLHPRHRADMMSSEPRPGAAVPRPAVRDAPGLPRAAGADAPAEAFLGLGHGREGPADPGPLSRQPGGQRLAGLRTGDTAEGAGCVSEKRWWNGETRLGRRRAPRPISDAPAPPPRGTHGAQTPE